MKSFSRGIASIAVLGAVTLGLTGCVTELPNPEITPVTFRGCIISDQDGFTDGGASEAAYNGMLQAKAVLGMQLSGIELSGKTASQSFTESLNKFVKDDCGLIVAVGDGVVGPLYESATEHEGQRYLLVDAQLTNSDGSPRQLANVRTLTFDNRSAGFIAGYLAASRSVSDKVGVVVGQLTPTVIEYVAGFKKGVQYLNVTESRQVIVFGAGGDSGENWTRVGSFDSLGKAERLAAGQIELGVDVIFAATGRGAIGALRAAAASQPADGAQPVTVINAENDSFVDPLYREVRGSLLASISRSTMRQVFESARSALDGSFTAAEGSYFGDFANAGVGLSPEHDVSWPAQSAVQLARLKDLILQGEVETR